MTDAPSPMQYQLTLDTLIGQAQVPEEVTDRVQLLDKLKRVEKQIKEFRNHITDSLKADIVPGDQLDGIVHTEASRSNVSWKGVYDEIYQEVLDRDQRRLATAIKSKHAAMTRYSTFKETG